MQEILVASARAIMAKIVVASTIIARVVIEGLTRVRAITATSVTAPESPVVARVPSSCAHRSLRRVADLMLRQDGGGTGELGRSR